METAVLDEAARVYEALQERFLGLTPLGRFSEWIAAGQAPSAKSLQDAGFRSDNPDHEGARKLRMARKAFIRRWGFAIPCAEAVAALAELGPLVEIGAGTGSWSALLSSAGQDVIATDAVGAGRVSYGFDAGAHHPVTAMEAATAVRTHQDRAVLCSWPTENDGWAADAAALIRPGQRLALIGEPRGGCTGSPALFDLLDVGFVLEQVVDLPQFPSSNDRLSIHRRV